MYWSGCVAAPTLGGMDTALVLDDLKLRHRALWELGDYPTVADTVIPRLGSDLVAASGIDPGSRVLDVAAGAGNATLPAARRGASVTASDLSQALLDECSRRAAGEGLSVECVPADAEDLPFPDGSFDAVLSCVGVQFAPHHDVVAAELARVTRPGGRVGLLSWTPGGFIGQLLGTVRPFAPPPPGAQGPLPWGDTDHVRDLLHGRTEEPAFRTGEVEVTAFGRPEEFREFFTRLYGPVAAVHRSLAGTGRQGELEEAIDALAASHMDASGAMRWEYVVALARR